MRLDVENVNGSAILEMLQHKELVITNNLSKKGYENYLDDEHALTYLEMMGLVDINEIALVKKTRQLAKDFQDGSITALEMFDRAKEIARKNITKQKDIDVLHQSRTA